MQSISRKILIIIILFYILIGYIYSRPPANINQQPDYYYKEGCKALKKHKLEVAKDNFKKGIESNMLSAHIPYGYGDNESALFSMKDYIKNAEDYNENGIEWKIYFYKGLLEANLIFMRGISNFTVEGTISNVNISEAIKSFEKSISIYDNYQSHIVLSILNSNNEENELNKAIDLALDNNYNLVASELEYYIAKTYEDKENYEDAIRHYEKGYSYSKRISDGGLGNFLLDIQNVNKKIEIYPKIIKAGFNNYKEYEDYKNKIEAYLFEIPYEVGWISFWGVDYNIKEIEIAIEKFAIIEKEFTAKIYATLGCYYERKENFAKALECYQQAANNNPDINVSYSEFYVGYLATSTISIAISDINEKIKLAPKLKTNNFDSYKEYEEYKVKLLEKCNIPEKNADDLNVGINLLDKLNDYTALIEIEGKLGRIFEKQQNYDDAISHYQNCLSYLIQEENYDSAGSIESNIASLYEKKGDLQEALAHYEKIYNNYWKESTYIAENIERIKEKITEKNNIVVVAITSPYSSDVIVYPKSANYKTSKSMLAPYEPRKGFYMINDETIWFNTDLDWKVSSQTLFQGNIIEETWHNAEFKTTVIIDYHPKGGFMTPGKMSAMAVIECNFE